MLPEIDHARMRRYYLVSCVNRVLSKETCRITTILVDIAQDPCTSRASPMNNSIILYNYLKLVDRQPYMVILNLVRLGWHPLIRDVRVSLIICIVICARQTAVDRIRTSKWSSIFYLSHYGRNMLELRNHYVTSM